MRRNCGLLRVCVVKCTDIAKSDAGVNDISIECSTEGLNYEVRGSRSQARVVKYLDDSAGAHNGCAP